MKKVKYFKIFNMFLAVAYLAVVVTLYLNPELGFSATLYWFPLLLLFLGLSMSVKAIMFSSDSSTWLSISLVLLSISVFLYHYYNLDWELFALLLVTPVAVASLVTGLMFKEIYQIRIMLWIVLPGSIVFLYLFEFLNVWASIPLLIGAVAMVLLISKLLPNRWYRSS